MAKKQRKYDMEYKIQAVKLAKEPGGAKTASEQSIPENTMYAWTKAAREGRLDAGPGSHTPVTSGHFPCVSVSVFTKYIFILSFSKNYCKFKQFIRYIFIKPNLCHFNHFT